MTMILEQPEASVMEGFTAKVAEYWQLLFEQAKASGSDGRSTHPFHKQAALIGRADKAEGDARAAAELSAYARQWGGAPIPAVDATDDELRAMFTAQREAKAALNLANATLQIFERSIIIKQQNHVDFPRNEQMATRVRLKGELTLAKQNWGKADVAHVKAEAVRRVRPFVGYAKLMELFGLSVDATKATTRTKPSRI